jgi:hypothetical protein
MRPATIGPAYGTPTVHRARMARPQRPTTQRPVRMATITQRPAGHYLCVALAMVLGAFVFLGVLGMVGEATGMLPATPASVTTTHTAAPHHTAAHTVTAAPRPANR